MNARRRPRGPRSWESPERIRPSERRRQSTRTALAASSPLARAPPRSTPAKRVSRVLRMSLPRSAAAVVPVRRWTPGAAPRSRPRDPASESPMTCVPRPLAVRTAREGRSRDEQPLEAWSREEWPLEEQPPEAWSLEEWPLATRRPVAAMPTRGPRRALGTRRATSHARRVRLERPERTARLTWPQEWQRSEESRRPEGLKRAERSAQTE